MGRVFVLKAFGRWAKSQGVVDLTLLKAIEDADKGIVAAYLGDDVVKLRVAREGQGKSGGYRTVVAFKKGERAFYLDGWAKNDFENISESHLKEMKKLAKIFFGLDEAGIQAAVNGGALREILEDVDVSPPVNAQIVAEVAFGVVVETERE